jgi:phosphoglycerate-specific signal transduction histidine kinase
MMVEFYECLDDSKDCSSNPLFVALEERSQENRNTIKKLIEIIMEELLISDSRFKEDMENINDIIAEHKEAEKQQYIKDLENISSEQRRLNQMLKDAGLDIMVENLKEGPDGIPETPPPNPHGDEGGFEGEKFDGDMEE